MLIISQKNILVNILNNFDTLKVEREIYLFIEKIWLIKLRDIFMCGFFVARIGSDELD